MLLTGLWDAKFLGAIKVIVYLDSQIAAQQLEGIYEVKNDRLHKYAKSYEKMKAEFQKVVLQKIPREENKKTDELARMASPITQWEKEDIIIRFELISQINQIPSPGLNLNEEVD